MQLVISSLVTGYGWIGSCWSFQIQSEKFVKSQCHCFLSSSLSSHFQDRVRDWMVRRIHLMHQSKYCRNRQKGMFAFIYVCLFVSTRITYSSFIRERGIPKSYNYKKFKLTFAKAKNLRAAMEEPMVSIQDAVSIMKNVTWRLVGMNMQSGVSSCIL